MAQIIQFLSRALPQAVNLPRPPPGGFAAPIAEGLAKVVDVQIKTLDELVERQHTVQSVEDFIKHRDKFTLDMDALETEIKQDPNSDNWTSKYREKANQILGQTLNNKMSFETRTALLRTTSEAVLRGQISIKADALKFKNDTIRAGIEDKADVFARQIALGANENEMQELFNHYESQQVISPAEKIKWTQKIRESADTFRAQRDLETDPASLTLATEDELLKKYPNLSTDTYFALISKQNAQIRKMLIEEEKGAKRLAVLEIREKANKGEITFADLDEKAQELGLSNEDYNFLRGPLNTTLNSSMKLMTDYMTTSTLPIGGEEALAQKFAPQQGMELTGILGEGGEGKSILNRKIVFAQRELQARGRYENPQDIWKQIADRHIKGITPEIAKEANRIIYGIEQEQPRKPTGKPGPTEENAQPLRAIVIIEKELIRRLQAKEITLDEFEDLAEALSAREDEFLGRKSRERNRFVDWMMVYFPFLTP